MVSSRRLLLNVRISFRKLFSPWRRLPDFLIIGVQKGGTTSLHHYLNQHSCIQMALGKEVHYFDRDDHYHKGVNWYKAFFPLSLAAKGQLVGEVTPRYMFRENVPARSHRLLPHAKIIVLLRDPVTRVYSHYKMLKASNETLPDFEVFLEKNIRNETISLEENGKSSGKKFNVLERSRYSDQIKRWLEYYPREQFLFLESETFFEQPETTLKTVHAFLGLPYEHPKDLTPQNTGKYNTAIDEKSRKILNEHFQESNDWLRRNEFKFRWL